MDNFNEIIFKSAKNMGISLSTSQIEQMLSYNNLLKEWNEKINLTAITDDNEAAIKHYVDSLTILPYLKNEKTKLIDVGTGAGFPGIPIKITYENIQVTLLDSVDKKVKFLNEVINLLNLKGISTIWGRAEDYGRLDTYREKFDFVVARAVASLPVLAEYCLPFVKMGGAFIAMKGMNTDELKESSKALQVLGGEVESVNEFVIPFTDIKRNIICIRKFRHSPSKYPRKAGKPSRQPII